MTGVTIPTSKDITIEIDGKKLAVVQSCTVKTVREPRSIEAFGSENPVATVGGKLTHTLELKKIVPVKGLNDLDFYGLSDFTIVIAKPDTRIVYSGCEWSSIGETLGLNSPCIETMQAVARKRLVL